MFAVEYRTGGPRSKWRPLSCANTSRAAEWQSFGWMLVFHNTSWHVGETAKMRVAELVESLRGRQAKVDAPGVLDRCEEAGVLVWAEGDNLRIKGPLTDELRDDLKRCKGELLKLLAEVPAWNAVEAADLERRLKQGHDAARPHLHPTEDDPFSIAGRNVLADILASVARAVAVRRMDHLRRRVDFALGWMATLDKRLHDLRTPGAWGQERQLWS